MVGVEGNNRRLPQWMLRVSDDTKPNENHVEEGPKTKKKSLGEKKNLLERPLTLAKCTTKRSKWKEIPLDSDADSDVSFDDLEKKNSRIVKKVPQSGSRRRGKRKKYMSSDEESDIHPLSEDEDADLTVDDLITIAKEYVRDEKKTEQDRESTKACELRRELPKTSSRNKSIDHNDAEIREETNIKEETRFLSEISVLENSENVVNITRTVDPAQDMLDLFLGPLLKKPAVDKKRDFSYFSQHSGVQSKTDVVREDLVPFVEKKKMSLKDKVAMFLD